MKSISVRDLLRFPEFKGCKEIDLIYPAMDKRIQPFLYMMGIDTEYPVQYTVNNHRDLANNTGIGYRIIGSIRCDREFQKSPFCELIDIVAVTGYQDTSLTKELVEMMGNPIDHDTFTEEAMEVYNSEEPEEYIEPDYEEVSSVIEAMKEELLFIRGSFVTTLE